MNTPKLNHEKKTKKIEILCTESQLNQIKDLSKKHHMSISELGLFCILNSQINVIIGVENNLILELNQLQLMHENKVLNKTQFEMAKEKLLKHSG